MKSPADSSAADTPAPWMLPPAQPLGLSSPAPPASTYRCEIGKGCQMPVERLPLAVRSDLHRMSEVPAVH